MSARIANTAFPSSLGGVVDYVGGCDDLPARFRAFTCRLAPHRRKALPVAPERYNASNAIEVELLDLTDRRLAPRRDAAAHGAAHAAPVALFEARRQLAAVRHR